MQTTDFEVFADSQLDELLSGPSERMQSLNLEEVPPRFARKFVPRSQGAIDREIVRVKARINTLREANSRSEAALLPLEQAAKQTLKRKNQRALTRLHDILEALQQETSVAHLDALYPRIDPSFIEASTFSAKHNCAVPLFAVFSLADPVCSIEATVEYVQPHRNDKQTGLLEERGITVSPTSMRKYFVVEDLYAMAKAFLLDKLRRYPQPTPETLFSVWNSWTRPDIDFAKETVKAQATFAGAIPESVRQAIRDAQPRFDEILIVAEAPEWAISRESFVQPAPIPVGVDPLVIGRKGESSWLIEAFDTTPAEDYVRQEFVKPR